MEGDVEVEDEEEDREEMLEVDDERESLELELGRRGCRIAIAPPAMRRGGLGSVPLHILTSVEAV